MRTGPKSNVSVDLLSGQCWLKQVLNTSSCNIIDIHIVIENRDIKVFTDTPPFSKYIWCTSRAVLFIRPNTNQSHYANSE